MLETTKQLILIALELSIFPKKIKNLIGNKIINASINVIQAYDSIMCR